MKKPTPSQPATEATEAAGTAGTTGPEVKPHSGSIPGLEGSNEYKYGFTTAVEMEKIAKGLSEDVIRAISAKKNEPSFLLEFRLKAYRKWLTMKEPGWAHVDYPPIDYQDIVYFAAPKPKPVLSGLDEVDPEILKTSRSWASPWTSRSASPTWP
jgi:hypothetical protein